MIALLAEVAHAQATHACDLLKREAVEAAVGAPLKDGRKMMANCIYDAASGKGQVVVQVRFRGDRLADFEDRKKAMQLAGGTLAPVTGVGDEAVWAAGPDHLIARKSGHVLDIDPGVAGKGPARDRAIAIGNALVAALH
jgi:hypothetical protein